MNTPQVSLIIPNHNKGAFLAATLKSIANQTYPHWEAILVDDGSTDNSIEIAESFCEKDERFVVKKDKKQPNGGSVCRNIGLQLAKGKYVLFFDSDDVLEPFCLERRVKFLENHTQLDFAVFAMHTFKQEPGDHVFIWQPEKEKAFERFLMHELPWQTMQPLYRVEFLKKHNITFNEHLGRHQDVFFHLEVLANNPSFEALQSKPDCYYRIQQAKHSYKPSKFFEMKASALNNIKERFVTNDRTNTFFKVSCLYYVSDLQVAKLEKRIQANDVKRFFQRIDEQTRKNLFINGYFTLIFRLPFFIPGLRGLFRFFLLIGK